MTRKSTWIWLALGLALALVGCTKSNRGAQIASGGQDTPTEEAMVPESESFAQPSPGQPPTRSRLQSRSDGQKSQRAPAAELDDSRMEESASEGRAAPAPWRRPGLATQWGEERDSQIREVMFTRGNYAPTADVSINYDDEDGVRAATGRTLDHAYAGVFPLWGGALSVSVVDGGGDPLPALQAGGRKYVVGDGGDRYKLRITNHTPGRFEVVATVDGLDVIDGQDGSFSKRGYILGPWASLDIEGFRDSQSTVRAFRFGSVEDSYAARRGKGRNIGVIGVALFAERGFHHYDTREMDRRRDADPFPSRFAPPPQNW
jgi:hypothetical protein